MFSHECLSSKFCRFGRKSRRRFSSWQAGSIHFINPILIPHSVDTIFDRNTAWGFQSVTIKFGRELLSLAGSLDLDLAIGHSHRFLFLNAGEERGTEFRAGILGDPSCNRNRAGDRGLGGEQRTPGIALFTESTDWTTRLQTTSRVTRMSGLPLTSTSRGFRRSGSPMLSNGA
jgi:hypothetical protein